MEMRIDSPAVYQNGMSSNGVSNNVHKRRRTEDSDMHTDWGSNNNMALHFKGKKFIPLRGGPLVFQSEDIHGSETLFLPLTEDILINMDTVEQISFSNGTYFIGNSTGTYVKSEPGHVINLWRYDTQQRQLYIARSFLFTHLQNFLEVKSVLECI
ncbi:uncharacterized protein LOC144436887 [Glandiceps talaboti]